MFSIGPVRTLPHGCDDPRVLAGSAQVFGGVDGAEKMGAFQWKHARPRVDERPWISETAAALWV